MNNDLQKELMNGILLSSINNGCLELDITEFINVLHRELPDRTREELKQSVIGHFKNLGYDLE